MTDDTFVVKDYGLKNFQKMIKNLDKVITKVGVLGHTNSRKGDGGNADIGRVHEFGIGGMPERSFLRMPMIDEMQNAIDNSKAFDRDTVKKALQDGSIKEWAGKLGGIAEGVILQAFRTNGYGNWPVSNMSRKKNHQTLVESQQLRNSITFEVEEN